MTRGKDEFCLMRSDVVAYKLNIVSASLFVKKVSVSPAVRLGHAQALLSTTAKYPIDRQYPSKPLQPDYGGGSAVREFYQLALASGKHLKNQALSIDREDFLQGYTLYAFNLTPDEHPVTKQKAYQYVVPESLRMAVLKGIHDNAGHQGQQRSLGLVRQRFYWDTMEEDVKDYVHNCKRCIVSKAPEPEARAPLVSITTSSPLELVCIDFWSAEDHNNKAIDVLVVTDHFTKLACAYPCPNQSAKTVARVLWNNFFCVYGFPVSIHSDHGANFESLLIAELCQLAGIDKTHTTPYHPMGNGQAERLNRTLGNMIRALPPRSKVKWPQMLNTLTFAYNCTVHETTGLSPFFLMYGRTPRLPVDLMFESVLLNGETMFDIDKYVQALKRDLCEAMKLAQSHSEKQQHKQAEMYNKRSKGQPVDIGQRVLLANKDERGKKKLADRWESTVYVVVDKNSLLNTYKLRSPSGVVKTVHRNLIMPVDFLPLPDADAVEEQLASLSGDELEDSSSGHLAEERTTQWVADLCSNIGGPVANSDELDEQNVMCEETAQVNDGVEVEGEMVTSATSDCDVPLTECDTVVKAVHDKSPVNEYSPTVQPSTFEKTELSVKRPDQMVQPRQPYLPYRSFSGLFRLSLEWNSVTDVELKLS
ncbi:Retrovirus-related Pol polyprotein [Labeo rohita]|uniref:Gypsy retrotransposon integrase-like protein 1 n=1 Tax=Labeo rohita TaxID=84645 RepID=A0ABQ8L2L1_LABRO|nr:Retrovirus-related Pol polyprotein [Labeo rohita]